MITYFEDQFLTGLLIFVRVAAVLFSGPLFMMKGIPKQLRLGLSVLITFLILPSLIGQTETIQFQLLSFVYAVVGEILVGLIIGMMSNYIFAAFQMAGQYIGVEMGYAMSMLMDPSSQTSMPVLSLLFYYAVFLIYLLINGHHYLLEAIIYSYDHLSIFNWTFKGITIEQIFNISGIVFTLSLKIAAPVMMSLFITSIALAFISKIVPQLNIFVVSFPLKIFIGLLTLTIIFPIMMGMFLELFSDFNKTIIDLIDTLRN